MLFHMNVISIMSFLSLIDVNITESPDQILTLQGGQNNGSKVINTRDIHVNEMSIIFTRVLHHFQHCTGYIMMGSRKGRGNQYIQFIRVLCCKLPTNGKQLPAFPLEQTEPRPQRCEVRVLPLCHHDPQ